METTRDGTIKKLQAYEIARLNPALIPLRELVGKTIVEVRDVVGYSTFGTSNPNQDNGHKWPCVIVCDDGTISQVSGQMAEQSFSEGTVEGLIDAGLITSAQVANLQAVHDKAERLDAEIEELRKERLELIEKLGVRHSFKAYRSLLKQIKGIEARLKALSALE